MSRQALDLLYKSFDAALTENELRVLEKALTESAALRKEKERIEDVRTRIAVTAQHSFYPGFADRIMNQIAREKVENPSDLFFESLITVFRPVAIAALVLIGVFITYNMTATEDISLKGAFAISDVYVEEAFDPIIELTAE